MIQKIVGIVAILTAFCVATKYIVSSETGQIRTDNSVLSTRVAALEDGQKALNKRIDTALNDAFVKAVSGNTVKPTSAGIEKSKQLILLAKKIDVRLNPATLAKFGTSLSVLSSNAAVTDEAWSTLRQAAEYRTFLNADYQPDPKSLTLWKNSKYSPTFVFSTEKMAGPDMPRTLEVAVWFAGGYVTDEDSARMDKLDQIKPENSRIGLFIIDGGPDAIVIDNMFIKNVIIRNAHIKYSGGPIKLINVSFVNCTFDFAKTKQGIGLSDAILQASAATYSFPPKA